MPNPIVDFPWEYSHVADDKVVCNHICVLHTVVINRCDTGATTATLYDGVDNTGEIIGIIDVDNDKSHYVLPVTLLYDCECETGIYIEFSQQNVEADLTVTFK